jgi:hypothetical protein
MEKYHPSCHLPKIVFKQAYAGNDTGVLTSDTVVLRGTVSQQFGAIIGWEWKIGSGSWIATGDPDTTAVMPDSEQTVICSLAVTDDDGNRCVDRIKIDVFSRVMSIVASFTHSLILTADGSLWACRLRFL